jgi:hypothetical protein
LAYRCSVRREIPSQALDHRPSDRRRAPRRRGSDYGPPRLPIRRDWQFLEVMLSIRSFREGRSHLPTALGAPRRHDPAATAFGHLLRAEPFRCPATKPSASRPSARASPRTPFHLQTALRPNVCLDGRETGAPDSARREAWRSRTEGTHACGAGHCPALSLAAGPRPQCPRMPCRNRSRSSGVIRSQRSAKRRRNLGR